MHRSALAEFMKIGTRAQELRTNKQISWRKHQGGVVSFGDDFPSWFGLDGNARVPSVVIK